MKRYAIAAAIAVAAFAGTSFVTPSTAEAATCTAKSRFASGWGQGSYSYARNRALYECAIRTPRGYNCYITHCSY